MLLDFDQGSVGSLCIVEPGFELGRRNVGEVACAGGWCGAGTPPQGGGSMSWTAVTRSTRVSAIVCPRVRALQPVPAWRPGAA